MINILVFIGIKKQKIEGHPLFTTTPLMRKSSTENGLMLAECLYSRFVIVFRGYHFDFINLHHFSIYTLLTCGFHSSSMSLIARGKVVQLPPKQTNLSSAKNIAVMKYHNRHQSSTLVNLCFCKEEK